MRLVDQLWSRYGALRSADIPDDAKTVAGQCVLDWLGCALAGSREPLSEILRSELGSQAGPCSVVGTDLECSPLAAALLNGAAGHALDFDDTHSLMGGHPTVPVLPAALAQAQAQGATGSELLAAFVVGIEVESRIGALVGPAPYSKGWHSTATVGVHGAAAAVCHLMGADTERFGHAVGLAGSQASGLKANFGTMTKPFHAGHAAERGLLSARLAMRGMTSNPEVIEGPQGYADAAASGRDALRWDRLEEQGDRFMILDTLFKYHAACYLTHSAIESAWALRPELARRGVEAPQVQRAAVHVHPGLLDVCGIASPATGLEAKFSLRATTALALLGSDTSDIATFVDSTLDSDELQRLIERIEVRVDERFQHTRAKVELTVDGATLAHEHDSGIPATDLEAQGSKLAAKMTGLASPIVGAENAERLSARALDLESVAHVAEVI